ncbi:MAG: toprim domain-containing protein, partial [Patescibacteria group bacterium]
TRYYDRFRNRLMFPIFDINGRVIAFSGRIMSDIIPSKTEKVDSGKYINSPETILYSKSRVLYGLDHAKAEIRKNNRVVLVEGQMDLLLPFQDGVKNIVATSGTALTEEQLLILKRLTDNLTLAFDMDDAGFRATKRGIDLATEMGFNVSVIGLPNSNDPADFVKNNSGEFLNLINASEPIMKYYFNQAFKKIIPQNGDIKLESKKLIALNILGEIKRLPSSIERSNWIRELSLRIGVSESDLKEEMEQLTWSDTDSFSAKAYIQNESAGNPHLSASKSRKEILSERLLALLLKKTEFIAKTVKAAVFMPKLDLEFLTVFLENNGNFSDIRSAISADLRSRLDFLYLLGDYELSKAESDFDIGKEINFLVKEIEREHHKEMLVRISHEIKKCESLNAGTDDLTREFQNISIKLRNIETYGKEKK